MVGLIEFTLSLQEGSEPCVCPLVFRIGGCIPGWPNVDPGVWSSCRRFSPYSALVNPVTPPRSCGLPTLGCCEGMS